LGKYALLKNDWALRGWSDLPFAIVNWKNSEVRELTRKSFYVAESCDGKTNFNSFAFIKEHHDILDKLILENIAEECTSIKALDDWQQYRKADNPYLQGIHWNITGKCNFNCRHCYMEAPHGKYGDLAFKDILHFIEQFIHANIIHVSLTGGEPFFRNDIDRIIEVLAEKKIWIREIFSNGSLINEDHLTMIRNNGFSPIFQISFDTCKFHDYMRGTKNTESRVIRIIKKLVRNNFRVVVATSIDKINVKGVAETYELMKDIGIYYWRLCPPQPSGNWRTSVTALSIDEEAKVCEKILVRWIQDDKPFHVQLAGFFRGFKNNKETTSLNTDRKDITIEPLLNIDKKSMPQVVFSGQTENTDQREENEFTPESYDCGLCREEPNLLPDGTLIICPGYLGSIMMDQMPNLLHQELSAVWTYSILRSLADLKKKELLALNPECNTCDMFKDCGMGCRASALIETGDRMKKDPITCMLWRKGYMNHFKDLAKI
jgi:radical SAM protein with 4Fe4S-binding SPASM domain